MIIYLDKKSYVIANRSEKDNSLKYTLFVNDKRDQDLLKEDVELMIKSSFLRKMDELINIQLNFSGELSRLRRNV